MQYFILIPTSSGRGMLKFIVVRLVDDEDVKGMIFVIRQSKILQCCELYANIELHILPSTNPQPIPHKMINHTIDIAIISQPLI